MNAIKSAYKFKCTECGADPHRPCVYMMSSSLLGVNQFSSKRQQELRSRVGKPTIKPHNARMQAARRTDKKKARWTPVPSPMPQDLILASRAMAIADREEYNRMRDWIKNNGSILTEPAILRKPLGYEDLWN